VVRRSEVFACSLEQLSLRACYTSLAADELAAGDLRAGESVGIGSGAILGASKVSATTLRGIAATATASASAITTRPTKT
jgi:hypothetical protein